jgi:uncharacterized protein
MMIKPLLVAILVASLTVVTAPLSWAGEAGWTGGILYEIRTSTALAPSFLFGTIHSEDDRVTDLPAPVRLAFDVSPGLALEVIPDAVAIVKAMVTMTYTDGRLLRDVLPEDLYLETDAALGEIGMTEDAFKDLKPWAVATLLSSPPSETGEFLDMLLYRTALAERKRIEGLETMAEQLAVFDDLAENDQVALLREALASREDLPAILEDLMTAYLDRDLEKLQSISDRHLADSDPRLATLFQEVVIDSRNDRMVERMAPLLDQGGWFIAIGALHLPGGLGVVEQLRRRGYDIRVAF